MRTSNAVIESQAPPGSQRGLTTDLARRGIAYALAVLAITTVGACATKPLVPYAANTPPLVLAPAAWTGVQDKRARFREIYCAVLDAHGRALPDYRPCGEALARVQSADLPYVFGYFPKTGNIAGKFTDVHLKLAELIQTYWTNFAKTGNPNSAGIPKWPQQGDNGIYIQFQQDGRVETAAGLRAAQCNIYRQWLTAQARSTH